MLEVNVKWSEKYGVLKLWKLCMLWLDVDED